MCQRDQSHSAAVYPPVNLNFSFFSHVSRNLIDFISIDSLVVPATVIFRLVDNLRPSYTHLIAYCSQPNNKFSTLTTSDCDIGLNWNLDKTVEAIICYIELLLLLTRALLRLERTMNLLEGGKGGEGRMGGGEGGEGTEGRWGGDVGERGRVGREGRVGERGRVGREGGWGGR